MIVKYRKSSKELNWIKGGCSLGDRENIDREESLAMMPWDIYTWTFGTFRGQEEERKPAKLMRRNGEGSRRKTKGTEVNSRAFQEGEWGLQCPLTLKD